MPLFTGSRLGFGKAVAVVAAVAADGGWESSPVVANSLRFNDDDSANLSKTLSTGSTTTWTYSCWFKLHNPGTNYKVTPFWTGSQPWAGISLQSDTIRYAVHNGGYKGNLITSQKLRDPSAWYHLVAVWDTTNGTSGDRARLYLNGSRITDFSTETYPGASDSSSPLNTAAEHKIGHEASNNKYSDCQFADIHFVDGLALDATSFGEEDATAGAWVPKEYTGSYGTNGFYLKFDNTSDLGEDSSGSGNDWTANNLEAVASGMIYSESSTWSYSGNGFGSHPPSNIFDSNVANYMNNSAGGQTITWDCSSFGLSGDLRFYCYGSAYTVSVNGTNIQGNPPNNVGWFECGSHANINEIKFTTSNGNAGIYLQVIEVAGSYLYDGVAASDVDLLSDSPSTYDDGVNGVGNYATLNPLDSGSNVTLSDGNLKAYIPSSNHCAKGNFGMSSGKWYWEVNITQNSGNTHGIAPTDFGSTNWCGVGDSLAYNGSNGKKYTGSTAITYGSNVTHGAGDIIGTAFDADSGSLTFYKNGVSLGVAWSDVDMTKTWVACCGQGGSTHTYNFGARSFAYTPPTDHKALNTFNLDDPTIADPSLYFDTKLYTGNGASSPGGSGSTQSIIYGFSPDFVWIKDRTQAGHNHNLLDTVRGAPNLLCSDSQGAEITNSTDGLTSFTSTGFTLGDNGDGSQSMEMNKSGNTYVAWAWDAGSSTVTNDDGSIDSEVRANPSAGFSVVSFTPSTDSSVGHGLNATPGVVMYKNREASGKWRFHHKDVGVSKTLYLEAEDEDANTDRVTAVTSTTFTVGAITAGDDHIAFCWSEIPGYSRISSYTGNGGKIFICTGFKPAMVFLKQTTGGNHWYIFDHKRASYLVPSNDAEELSTDFSDHELLSNGFSFDTNNAAVNGSGDTYAFCAFAESPFKYSNAR